MVLLVLLDWDIPFRRILRRFWVHCCETRICCSKQNIFVELVTYKIRCRPTFSLSLFLSLFPQYLLTLKGKGHCYPTGDSILWEHITRWWNLLKHFKTLASLSKTIFCTTIRLSFLWCALRLCICIDAAIEIRGDMVIHFWSGSIKSKFVE